MTDVTRMDDDGIKLTELQARRRRQRNVAIGVVLAGLVGLFYLVTLIKLGVTAGMHH